MINPKYYQSKEFYIAYSVLINAAQHHGLATYQEIALATGLPTIGNNMASEIGQLIGAVSENEVQQGRPMLSALAVGVSGKPGEGFTELAKKINHFQEGMDGEDFWEKECQAVYEEWKTTYPKIYSTK